MTATEEIYSEEYFNYLHKRNPIRKLVRTIYLRNISSYCKGPTIDFGCGVGELLKILPEGSVGFEVNKIAVAYCKKNGLNVEVYSPDDDNYNFNMIGENKFETFTMNHVLEHLKDSATIIEKIFNSCNRLGIARIVFTVPGHKGFQSDATHETFIDLEYLKKAGILENKYYRLQSHEYFPVNWKTFSNFFTHNELRLVFDKRK